MACCRSKTSFHLRRPGTRVFEIANGSRVVGQGDIRIDGARFGPLGEAGMELRQFVDVDPDRLQHAAHDGVGQFRMADQINVVGVDTGVIDNAS